MDVTRPDDFQEFVEKLTAILESKESGWIVLTNGETFYVKRSGQKISVRPMAAGSAPEPKAEV